jgi:hypothetical protein
VIGQNIRTVFSATLTWQLRKVATYLQALTLEFKSHRVEHRFFTIGLIHHPHISYHLYRWSVTAQRKVLSEKSLFDIIGK